MDNDEYIIHNVTSLTVPSCEQQSEVSPERYQEAIRSAGLAQAAIQNRDFHKTVSKTENNKCDNTKGNLRWLLNYKIQELPPIPETQFEIKAKVVKHSKEVHNETEMEPTRPLGPIKPSFTFPQLIESAINQTGNATVSEIYRWITQHFAYYKPNDDRWKNCIRHNLSTNPRFRKGDKSPRGAGHLWTIARRDFKTKLTREKMQRFLKEKSIAKSFEQDALSRELEATAACLLGKPLENFEPSLETELEAATPNFLRETLNNFELRDNNIKDDETLNVFKNQKKVEDFLCCPVSKQQIAQKSDLGNKFLITDLNPITLGLNFSENAIITEDSLYNI